jgi:23S rRNA (cytidine1920-2'-O)/16S rRNA (cytidine1409-2'-O)-methyltransferase
VAEKIRIDHLLVEKGLLETRSLAQRMVMAGRVRIDGQVVFKPGHKVPVHAAISIDTGETFVSRGGDKLAAALDTFDISVEGLICADVGASTGGFTDCLLQKGASRVYSIDVGYGQLHWRLRNDSRVVVMERTNARYLESLDEYVSLTTIDVSFISLRLILEAAVKWMHENRLVVALIKPQFEAGREAVGKGGVVRDNEVHKQVILKVIDDAAALSLYPMGLIRSPLKGPKGNIEFLLALSDIEHPFDTHGVTEMVILEPGS